MRVDLSNVEEVFSYHAPTAPQIDAMNAVRESAKQLAIVILNSCPQNAERTRALNDLSDLTMKVNKAIILDGKGA